MLKIHLFALEMWALLHNGQNVNQTSNTPILILTQLEVTDLFNGIMAFKDKNGDVTVKIVFFERA